MSGKIETVLSVGGQFPEGAKVEVHPRLQDTLDAAPPSKAAATATVKNGEVRLSGLEPHGPYFLTGTTKIHRTLPGAQQPSREREEFRAIRFNAAGEVAPDEIRHTQAETVAQQQAEAHAANAVRSGVPGLAASPALSGRHEVSGARNTQTRTQGENPLQNESIRPQPAQERHDAQAAENARKLEEADRLEKGGQAAEAKRLRDVVKESGKKASTQSRSKPQAKAASSTRSPKEPARKVAASRAQKVSASKRKK